MYSSRKQWAVGIVVMIVMVIVMIIVIVIIICQNS